MICLMATAKCQVESVTKQITVAAFQRFIHREEENSINSSSYPALVNTFPISSGQVQTSASSRPLEEAPSPPLSPSAITPGIEDIGDCWSEQRVDKDRKMCSSSSTITQAWREFLRQQGIEEVELDPTQERVTDQVVCSLRVIGDQFNNRLLGRSLWRALISGFMNPDGSVLQKFIDTIYSLKKELSLQMIVRLFYLGFRMIHSLIPRTFYDEQQSRMIEVFIEFLVNELSEWIDEQGGWEEFLSDSNQRSQSTPVLVGTPPNIHTSEMQRQLSTIPSSSLPQSPITPTHHDQGLVDIVSSEHELTASCPGVVLTPFRSERSNSLPVRRPPSSSLAIPRIRPSTLNLRQESNSFPRLSLCEEPLSSPGRRSSLGSVVSFGVGVSFGFALFTFLFG